MQFSVYLDLENDSLRDADLYALFLSRHTIVDTLHVHVLIHYELRIIFLATHLIEGLKVNDLLTKSTVYK